MLTRKTAQLFISDNVTEALQEATAKVQARLEQGGDAYNSEDIQAALATWLALCVEDLADEALFHCVEGDSSRAFNRRAFESELRKIKPISVQAA